MDRSSDAQHSHPARQLPRRGEWRHTGAVPRLDDAELVHPTSRQEWRAWLEANHATSPGVWWVSFRESTGRRQLSYDDMVEELLCFGWIDSTARKLDDERTMLYVAPRKKGGTWAATNKTRVERLLKAGLMHDSGLRVIEEAKADGSWTVLDSVEALEVPPDLRQAFKRHPQAGRAYEALTPGRKKQLLWSVVSAKREETRSARIAALVERAESGEPLVR